MLYISLVVIVGNISEDEPIDKYPKAIAGHHCIHSFSTVYDNYKIFRRYQS